MKNRLLYILFAAGLLVAMTACEPKFDYSWTSYVIMDETSVSIAEDDETGILTLGVSAFTQKGTPRTDVSFELIDGDGDNGAKQGVDYTLISPVNGMLYFEGESTLYIQIRISNANVGVYTGRKTFKVVLTDVSNGYDLGGAYTTTVTITDADRNLDAVGIAGTYMAEGIDYPGVSATWELTVHQDENDSNIYWVDGLTPEDAGMYALYGTGYCAMGYYGDASEETFVIPSQISASWYESSYGLYIGWVPCTQYDGSWYFGDSSGYFPNLTFYMLDSDTWESDYGMFLAGFTSNEMTYDSFYNGGFFDVVAPPIKIYRID